MIGRLSAATMVVAAMVVFRPGVPQAVAELCGISLADRSDWRMHDEGMFELWFPSDVQEASHGGIDSRGGSWLMAWGEAGYDWGIYSSSLTDLSGPGQGQAAVARECQETPPGSTRTVIWTVPGSREVHVGSYWDNATAGQSLDDRYRDRLVMTLTLADSTHLPDALSVLASLRIRPVDERTEWVSEGFGANFTAVEEQEVADTRALIPVGTRVRFRHGSPEWHAGRIGEITIETADGGSATCLAVVPHADARSSLLLSRLWTLEALPEDRTEWVQVSLIAARMGDPRACSEAGRR